MHLIRRGPGDKGKVGADAQLVRCYVVSTLDLFDWWKLSDWSAIRAAVLGKRRHPNWKEPLA